MREFNSVYFFVFTMDLTTPAYQAYFNEQRNAPVIIWSVVVGIILLMGICSLLIYLCDCATKKSENNKTDYDKVP